MSAFPVLVFSDFTCPFSYVTEAALRQLEATEDVVVRYGAFELYPAPEPLPPPGEAGWETMLRPLAEELALPLRVPEAPVRTRKAHEAAAFAAEKGVERGMREAIFAAYFAERRDIGRIDVLVELCAALGLDPSEAKVVLDVDRFTGRVARTQAAARTAGVEGVPTLLVGTGTSARVLVGARPYAELREEILGA